MRNASAAAGGGIASPEGQEVAGTQEVFVLVLQHPRTRAGDQQEKPEPTLTANSASTGGQGTRSLLQLPSQPWGEEEEDEGSAGGGCSASAGAGGLGRILPKCSHVPAHLGGCRPWHSQPTPSPASCEELSAQTSQEPRASTFIYFSPLLWKAVCSACGGPTPSRCSRPAVSAPAAAGLGLFFFARRFCFHDHTNCNKLYKKTLASP